MKSTFWSIPVTRTALVAVRPVDQPSGIALILHGYAQTNEEIMAAAMPGLPDDISVVAPEGLSRFYRRGVAGEVVASWMTRRERLAEIQDYTRYLDQVVGQIKAEYPQTPITVIGFSQGVATACRWLAAGEARVDRLILWAGTPPEDRILHAIQQRLDVPSIVVVGDMDPYLPEVDLGGILNRWQSAWPHLRVHRFVGGHVLDPQVLRKIWREW